MRKEVSVWLVRAGRKDEAKLLFLEKTVIALGPAEVGDLSEAESTRDAFKACYRKAFPQATRTGVGGIAGQLFRFIHEARIGDYVLYPSKDRKLHIGTIQGKYLFSEAHDPRFPHRREVKWTTTIGRDECSQALLNEARAFKSFYGITKFAGEVVHLASSGAAKG